MAGDPMVAPSPTNILTLLLAPVIPTNALGIQGVTPTIRPATRWPGSLEAPLLAGPNTLWMCLRITQGEMGVHKHPALSSFSSLVFFAFF